MNFIRRLDKIQHDRAETTDRNVFRPLDVRDMRQGAVVLGTIVSPNKVLLKWQRHRPQALGFRVLGRR